MRHATTWVMGLVLVLLLACWHGQAWAVTFDGQEDICATPAVVFCDNFENRAIGVNDLQRAIYKNLGWTRGAGASVSVINTQGKDGTKAVQFSFPPNDGAGSIVTDNGINGQFTNVYIRWYSKYSPGFKWSANATKHVLVQNNNVNASVNSLYTDHYYFGPFIFFAPIFSTTYPLQRQSPNAGTYTETTNTWNCYENHYRMNTSNGASDGLYEGWINGALIWNDVNVNLTNTSSGTPKVIGMNIDGYWNCTNGDLVTHPCTSGTPEDTHAQQFRYLDNVVVSTAKIGCIGAAPPSDPVPGPPAPPTGLNVTWLLEQLESAWNAITGVFLPSEAVADIAADKLTATWTNPNDATLSFEFRLSHFASNGSIDLGIKPSALTTFVYPFSPALPATPTTDRWICLDGRGVKGGVKGPWLSEGAGGAACSTAAAGVIVVPPIIVPPVVIPPVPVPKGLILSSSTPDKIVITADKTDCAKVLTSTLGSTVTMNKRTVTCVK